MKMLAVGDSYMPTGYFQQAFDALGRLTRLSTFRLTWPAPSLRLLRPNFE